MPAWAKELPVKTLSIEKKADAYEIAIQYPATGNAAIDGEIAAWANKEAVDFVKLAAGADRQAGDNPYELDWSFEVARNDGAVFADIFSEEADTGGAHPNHDIATFNFEVPGGWRLYLPEIFERKALAKISGLAVADLTKQFADSHNGGGDPDWVKQGAGPDWDNFRDFILDKDKLQIHYPDYQVAAYAEGPQETDIPLAALKGLRAEYDADRGGEGNPGAVHIVESLEIDQDGLNWTTETVQTKGHNWGGPPKWRHVRRFERSPESQ